MAKITLTDLVNLTNQTTAVNAINSNNAAIRSAMEKTLSRDGTSPNQMTANLDMNSQRIINLPVPVGSTEPLRKGDLTNFQQFQNSVDLAAALASAQASATSSATSATNSATSATNSANYATNSANSATSAATSATNAANSAALAATYSTYINIFNYIPGAQQAAIIAGTSTYDAGPDINTALNAAAGQPVYFPKGTYVIQTQIKPTNSASLGLTYGPNIIGNGKNTTIFKNQVGGAQLLNAFTTNTSDYAVSIAWPSHGMAVNDVFTLFNLGSGSYGGLNMEGDWAVASVPDANHVIFYHYNAATSAISNVGSVSYTKACMHFDTAGALQVGLTLRDFQIQNSGSPIGSTGIQFRRVWGGHVDNLWINGAVADGIHIPCVLGDADGTSMVSFSDCRIANCGRWGINCAASNTNIGGVSTGHNEISNTSFKNITIDSCGSSQSSYIYGGGFKWKGQVTYLDNVAFTTCRNCGIYIGVQNGAGNPSVFQFGTIVIENCTGRNFVVEGLDTMVGGTLEMYNGDSFVATNGLYMNATSYIKNINIQSGVIRASSGNNPYVAYAGVGANFDATTTRIYTPSFQIFGTAGQTQVSGFTFRT